MDVMQHRPNGGQQILRAGAVATLSRNILQEFLRPTRQMPEVETVIRFGAQRDLLVALHTHEVDDMPMLRLLASEDECPHWCRRRWFATAFISPLISAIDLHPEKTAWRVRDLDRVADFHGFDARAGIISAHIAGTRERGAVCAGGEGRPSSR